LSCFTVHATSYTFPRSLHDALPISPRRTGRTEASFDMISNKSTSPGSISKGGRYYSCLYGRSRLRMISPAIISPAQLGTQATERSEEHTSELQSRFDLVCRLLLEKK